MPSFLERGPRRPRDSRRRASPRQTRTRRDPSGGGGIREPEIGVLVLTMFGDDDSVFAAIRAGARGYALKGSGQDEIVRAIRAVASGEAIFGPAATQWLMAFCASMRAGPRRPSPI